MKLTVYSSGNFIEIEAMAIRCEKPLPFDCVKRYKVQGTDGQWYLFYKKHNKHAKLPVCEWYDGELPIDLQEAARVRKERREALDRAMLQEMP